MAKPSGLWRRTADPMLDMKERHWLQPRKVNGRSRLGTGSKPPSNVGKQRHVRVHVRECLLHCLYALLAVEIYAALWRQTQGVWQILLQQALLVLGHGAPQAGEDEHAGPGQGTAGPQACLRRKPWLPPLRLGAKPLAASDSSTVS